jgi:hypothetical protein
LREDVDHALDDLAVRKSRFGAAHPPRRPIRVDQQIEIDLSLQPGVEFLASLVAEPQDTLVSFGDLANFIGIEGDLVLLQGLLALERVPVGGL